VRAYNVTWYREIIDNLPRIENGYAYPPEGVGAGLELLDSFLSDPGTTIRGSDLWMA
jgi:L-alanine-DL-glutamate epimerase-like enolase superfamily enzyme